MLTYLINVTGDLFTAALVTGVMLAFTDQYCARRGQRAVRIGLAAGFAAAAIRAFITNTRRLVGGWKVGAYGFGIALVIFVLFAAAFVIFYRKLPKRQEEHQKANAAQTVLAVLSAALIAAFLYCALPNVYAYPFKFDTGGNGIFSTDYLFRLGGYLLGILLCLVAAASAYRIVTLAAAKGMQKAAGFLVLALNIMYAVYNFARLMLVLTPRKIVNSIALFNFAAASNNHSHVFTWIAFLLLAGLGIVLWVRSHTVKEPYATPAEHRKQKVLWRTGKRFTAVLLACFVMAVLCATLFVKLNTVVIREAPVEDPVLIKDGAGNDLELRVPLEMVEDGHLHRFGYTTQDGNPTRFIVILKQEGTTNYGIGLDACEICGEAGYYENNEGQVVCKKCGVVMNKTTIGMKGGCNPIIIDYDINESYITVPVSEMVRTQSHFKK